LEKLLEAALGLTWEPKANIISRLSRSRSRLKRISDSFAFARESRVLEGTLAISSLERLQDLLADASGEEVTFRIEGFKGARGQSMLHLKASGVLPLACQRCLEAIHFELDIDSLLELIPADAELSQEELDDDTRDFLPVAGELDVAELVEDEVLLALPAAPRHERCSLPGAPDAGERINPFAVLDGLKGKPN